MSRRHRGPAPVHLGPNTPPVAEAIRRPGRLFDDSPQWVIAQCPYCRRRHVHRADPVATSLVIGAKCSTVRFYKVQEQEAAA